jgi:hypothetical protein
MRQCCVCNTFLVPCNEGIDHIGFSAKGGSASGGEPYEMERIRFLCQSCLNAIQNQVEYGISYKYANV